MRLEKEGNIRYPSQYSILHSVVIIQVTASLPPDWRPGHDIKIVGGDDAENDEFPFVCSVKYWNFHSCGCSLIHMEWAITAAHCVTLDNTIEKVSISKIVATKNKSRFCPLDKTVGPMACVMDSALLIMYAKQ